MNETRVIALGFFDGVHSGHRVLMARARRAARELGCRTAVLTFDNHPDELVFGTPTPLINTLEDRRWLLMELNHMDEVISLPFDRALMQMPWEEFVDELLVKKYHAAHVVCGHDFSFGYRGEGKPDKLRKKCAALGIGCDVVEPVLLNDFVVSSSEIRTLLRSGSVEAANYLLSHRHFITGTVMLGKQMGRQLGIPTANIQLPKGVLAPAFGVYATNIVLEDGRHFMAVTNVGTCPTVEIDTGVTVEPWLLDFNENLYGKTIRVEFCRFLRHERKFESLDALKKEILRNAQETRNYFAEHPIL